MQINLSRQAILAGFFFCIGILLLLFVVPQTASAQTLELSPSAGTLSIGTDHAIEVRAGTVAANTNTAIIALVGPSSLIQFKDLTPAAGTLQFDCNGYSGGFDNDEICTIISKPGVGNYYAAGELIATITITAVGNGQAALDFTTIGSETSGYTDGVTSYDFTDRGGTYTTGSGGGSVLAGSAGTLPETGITDDPRNLFLFVGLLLITAIIINRLGYVFQLFGIPVKPTNWIPNLFHAVKENDPSRILDIDKIKNRERDKLNQANDGYQEKILKAIND